MSTKPVIVVHITDRKGTLIHKFEVRAPRFMTKLTTALTIERWVKSGIEKSSKV